jgi:uncharacterized cupredoxin-like copper-binding protein
MTRRLPALFVVPLLSALALATSCASGGEANSSSATIPIHYSHYTNELVTARVGEPVTITIQNDDPIAHEWIVGTEAVHERHRTGTEPFHGTIPTEVTIPALSTRVTTVTFREPGDYQYICHLPGHEQYGMVGTLHVTAQ